MKNDDQRSNRSGKLAWHYTPLVKAGYIEDRGEYFIRPAKDIGGTTFARIRSDTIPSGLKPWGACKNASEIWFQHYQKVRGKYAKVVRASAQQAQDLIKGALVRSGLMASKRSEAVIYPPNEDAELIQIPDELVAAYKDQVSQEQEHLLGKMAFYAMNNRSFT